MSVKVSVLGLTMTAGAMRDSSLSIAVEWNDEGPVMWGEKVGNFTDVRGDSTVWLDVHQYCRPSNKNCEGVRIQSAPSESLAMNF